jgi:hypothetical protein
MNLGESMSVEEEMRYSAYKQRLLEEILQIIKISRRSPCFENFTKIDVELERNEIWLN